MASASLRTFQKCLASSALTARLQPVPIGSISTRSVKRSQVSGLSRRLRARASGSSGAEIEHARADQAEMEKGGGRARAAVEHEGERPVGAGVLRHIGGVEHRGALLAGLVVEGERAGGRRVSELAARRVDRMLGDRIRRQQPQHAVAGSCCAASGRLASLAHPARRRSSAPAKTSASAKARDGRNCHGMPALSSIRAPRLIRRRGRTVNS